VSSTEEGEEEGWQMREPSEGSEAEEDCGRPASSSAFAIGVAVEIPPPGATAACSREDTMAHVTLSSAPPSASSSSELSAIPFRSAHCGATDAFDPRVSGEDMVLLSDQWCL